MIDKIRKKAEEWATKNLDKFKSKKVEPCEVDVQFEGSNNIESFSEFSSRMDKQGYYDSSKLQSLFKQRTIQDEYGKNSYLPPYDFTSSNPYISTDGYVPTTTTTYSGSFGTVSMGYNPVFDSYLNRHKPIDIYKKHKGYLSKVNKFVDRWTEDPIETERRLEYKRKQEIYKQQLESNGGLFLKDPYEDNPFRTLIGEYKFEMPYNKPILEDYVDISNTPSGIYFTGAYTSKPTSDVIFESYGERRDRKELDRRLRYEKRKSKNRKT